MLWLVRIRRFLAQGWHNLSDNGQVLIEKPLPTEELTKMLGQGAIPSVGFYALLALATVIATWGLLGNNAVTIIGAMIIAPLMNPIVSLSYATIAGEQRLLQRATLTLVTGMILVLALSFLASNLLGTRVVGSEILARIEPSLLDLGVAIASGAAASLAYARRNISNALPGVAIAVALVPPLCVTGIGLALGQEAIVEVGLYFGRVHQEFNLASGSFLLFLTNLAGIVFCTGLVFLIQGYGNLKKALAGLSLTLVLLGLVSLPLYPQLQNVILRDRVIQSLDQFARRRIEDQEEWIDRIDATDIYIDNREEEIFVRLNVIAPIGAISQRDMDLLQESLSKDLEKPVKLEINLFLFEILQKEPLSTPDIMSD